MSSDDDSRPARPGRPRYAQSLEHRLALVVGLGLLLFSLAAGALTYVLAYRSEIEKADDLERQLGNTVVTQVEVAVFAGNQAIAEGVVNGLLASPLVEGVRVQGVGGFATVGGHVANDPGRKRLSFELHSPIDGQEVIGTLELHPNLAFIDRQARTRALHQTLMLLVQIFVATVLLVLVTRRWISQPVIQLSNQVAAIEPCKGGKVAAPDHHRHDELGRLADNINMLIKAAEGALREAQALAVTDSLTGLPNRRHFIERLEDEFARLRRFPDGTACVLMLDLDHFKSVNDRFGHAAGDVVLRRLAKIIHSEVRKVDTPGRLGGEEFAILLPGADLEAAKGTAERLRSELARAPIEVDNGVVEATLSIGVARMRPDDPDSDAALKRADAALYRAKESGRNRLEVES